jgi:hypothetical protein
MGTALDISSIISALDHMPEQRRVEVIKAASVAVGKRLWIPNPGPQTDAYFCKADELFYGGSAGGGKTDVVIGLAVTSHQRSLILRRTNREALGIDARIQDLLGSRDGHGEMGWRVGDRIVEVSGCQLEDDKQKFKGAAHDLKVFDEVSDFSESQYVFISGWNRSTVKGQRCRVVATGNPPTRPEGFWVMKRWGAWLDPNHHNPAEPGELRWYTTGDDDREIETNGPGPHRIRGEWITARSRTFIPAKLSDNPDLAATNYAAVLSALPPELRDAYRDGQFDAARKDNDYQVIPTHWIRAAQKRWTPQPPPNAPMCCIGVDVAQGGDDQTVLAIRHDGWFAPFITVPGRDTPDGPSVAGLVIQHRRDGAHVVIDMGGGYGGSAMSHLQDNAVKCSPYKGVEASFARTCDRHMRFFNTRTASYWLLREALDPGQPGGSWISLPDDPELVADLTAPTFEYRSGKLQVEAKKDVCKRLGRSTDKGDACVMALFRGETHKNQIGGYHQRPNKPIVLMSQPRR